MIYSLNEGKQADDYRARKNSEAEKAAKMEDDKYNKRYNRSRTTIEKNGTDGRTHLYHTGGPNSVGNRNDRQQSYNDINATSHLSSDKDDTRSLKAASTVMKTAKKRPGESDQDFERRLNQEMDAANSHYRKQEKKVRSYNASAIFKEIDIV